MLRDLLVIREAGMADLIDFDHMTRLPTSFVQRDFRHVEADVVLQAPLRRVGKQQPKQTVTVYILIEHQSEPDAMMAFRVLEYVVQIYKAQARDWHRRHKSFVGLRLQPVLPVVFYTGTRHWEALGRVADLIDMGERFTRMIPAIDPMFLNLSAIPADQLEAAGGFFGWVLRLVQDRHAPPAEFEELLRRATEHLETMAASERLRWLELLSFVHALVYHERDPVEHGALQTQIEASVRTDKLRREVSAMGRTIADELIDKGRYKGRKEEQVRSRRQILLNQLQRRFGTVPSETVAAVKANKSVPELDAWLDRFATAGSLEEVGIGS